MVEIGLNEFEVVVLLDALDMTAALLSEAVDEGNLPFMTDNDARVKAGSELASRIRALRPVWR